MNGIYIALEYVYKHILKFSFSFSCYQSMSCFDA